jgi:DNA-binding GntR family transcriptional regulator
LIEELNQGDPERADRAMRAHIRYGMEANVSAIAERPETKAFERVK